MAWCRIEVADLFEESVDAAVRSIKAQIDASKGLVKSVWLVGGFAASPWLFSQLQERLGPLGIVVSRPDSQTYVPSSSLPASPYIPSYHNADGVVWCVVV